MDSATLVDALRASLNGHGHEHDVTDVTDVTEPMGNEGSTLLGDVESFLKTYVAYPSEHTRVAHTLWIAHTHAMDAWDSTPRLAFLSPEPGSGKTRALEASELLVPRPVEAINVTAAYLFRKVDDEDGAPTVLFDEIDTVFGPKARDHEDVRGLLNAGHRKGAVAGRCVVKGKSVETVEYPAYCAVAMAGLGDLPDTILTRSVVVRMRRRAPNERVEPFRRRIALAAGHALHKRLAAWSAELKRCAAAGWPLMPDGVEDRDADVWEALLAVADAAGGEWPARARAAAVALVAESKESTPSLGIRLLADLRAVFADRGAMHSATILTALLELPEAPWSEVVAGKPLNTRGLSKRLSGYGIKSKPVRIGEKVERGYSRDDLADAWSRYLPPPAESEGQPPSSPKATVTTVTSVTPEAADDPFLDGDDVDAADEPDGERVGGEAPARTQDTPPIVPSDCGQPNLCRHLGPCPAWRQSGSCSLAAAAREGEIGRCLADG
jgi:hypothetical protein